MLKIKPEQNTVEKYLKNEEEKVISSQLSQ